MVMSGKKALVLSGGSIKGSFQVGGIQAVLESGFVPDFIYGISVGALNGSFLCSEAGEQKKVVNKVDWEIIGSDLVSFWKENIKQPSDVITQRSWLNVGASALFDDFNGIVGINPLEELIKKKISIQNLRLSPAELKIGAVNINNGAITYVNPVHSDFIEYLVASASTPIMMPIVKIDNQPFADGGVREIAPLKTAINSGASDIIVIACQAHNMGGPIIDPKNIIQLIERVFDVMTTAIVDNDIELVQYFNRFLPDSGLPQETGPLSGYRKVRVRTIRPTTPINLDIRKFTQSDIEELIDQGYQAGQKILQPEPQFASRT